MFIDQGGLVYWSAAQATTNTVPLAGALIAGPTGGLTGNHFLQASAAAGSVFSGTAPRPFSQPLFNTTPTINDKSIYDWSSINLSAPNRFWDRTETYYIKLIRISWTRKGKPWRPRLLSCAKTPTAGPKTSSALRTTTANPVS